MPIKAIFLDRDGVINKEVNYLFKIEDFEFIDGIFDACLYFQNLGYAIIIVTNQSGIGRKIFSIEMLHAVHKKMNAHLLQFGGVIDGIFFCPCKPEENCNCRKPKPGLYNNVSDRLQMPLKNVFCVGDKITDIQAAENAGGNPILVRTGKGKEEIDGGLIPKHIPIYDDLASFVDKIITEG